MSGPWFTQSTHPYVGTVRVFLPRGTTPYAPGVDDGVGGELILPAGDAVDVESAWTRPYLPADAPILLFVRSHITGKASHVTEDEIRLSVAQLEVAR